MIESWEYKEIYDVKRCIYTYLKIKSEFYGKETFYLTDRLPKENPDMFVVFPNFIKNLQGHRLLELAKMDSTKTNNSLFDEKSKISQSLIENIMGSFNTYATFDVKRLSKLKHEWESVEKVFLEELQYIFPNIKGDKKGKYKVIFTRFGTIGSYIDQQPYTNLVLREDAAVSTIAELVIANVFRQNAKYVFSTRSLAKFEKTIFWFLTEGITDVLMQTKTLKELFPKFTPTLNNLLSTTDEFPHYRKSSDNYLKELGFEIANGIEIKNNTFINTTTNKPIVSLSSKEQEVLKHLIDNENELVSYEDIAQILWGEEYLNKFSLNTINKVIHSIRTKLTIQKIVRTRIKTNRGWGYTLVQ